MLLHRSSFPFLIIIFFWSACLSLDFAIEFNIALAGGYCLDLIGDPCFVVLTLLKVVERVGRENE